MTTQQVVALSVAAASLVGALCLVVYRVGVAVGERNEARRQLAALRRLPPR